MSACETAKTNAKKRALADADVKTVQPPSRLQRCSSAVSSSADSSSQARTTSASAAACPPVPAWSTGDGADGADDNAESGCPTSPVWSSSNDTDTGDDAEESEDGSGAGWEPIGYCPTSPHYGCDCSENPHTGVISFLNDMIDFANDEAARAMRNHDLEKKTAKLAALLFNVRQSFGRWVASLPLSRDVAAYSKLTEQEEKHLPHWERNVAGLHTRYQLLTQQLCDVIPTMPVA